MCLETVLRWGWILVTVYIVHIPCIANNQTQDGQHNAPLATLLTSSYCVLNQSKEFGGMCLTRKSKVRRLGNASVCSKLQKRREGKLWNCDEKFLTWTKYWAVGDLLNSYYAVLKHCLRAVKCYCYIAIAARILVLMNWPGLNGFKYWLYNILKMTISKC